MLVVGRERLLVAVADEGTVIGRRCRAHPRDAVTTCPGWDGGDLLAHLSGFARWIPELFAGRVGLHDPFPVVEPPDALRYFGTDLRRLLGVLRRTDPATPVANWEGAPPGQAGFWLRRAAHEFGVHRADADTLLVAQTEGEVDEPRPIAADLAHDGLEEFFDAFVDAALATGAAPPSEATLALEITDRGSDIRRDLPHPGPVTTLRGTAAELLLAVWHRRDLAGHFVSGDRAMIENWPRI